MKTKMKILLLCIGLLTMFAACDMVRIIDDQDSDNSENQDSNDREITKKERDELEKNGRFLKLINLPLNTQAPNVFSVSVANSSTAVGKFDKNSSVLIYRDTANNTCTAYLPLISNDDKEFLETGFFFTSFSIHVDALTKYVVEIYERFVVSYTDGRGQADVNDLPSTTLDKELGPASGSKELTTQERDELEKNGRFLKLINLPLNTQVPNVFSVSVANSSTAVGKLDKNSPVYIYRETATNTCTAYLPLVNNNNSNGYLENEFIETGFFYTSFSIHVDALTKYIVDISDHFIVLYTDGRGLADVNNLPSPAIIIHEPHYLTVFNLPQSVSKFSFSNVFVHNQAGPVAKCADYSQIVLSVHQNKATAKIPLLYNSLDQDFTETGVFHVVFDINVDVETRFTVKLDDTVKVSFINGNGNLDILNIPDKPVPYLTLKGLPLNTTKQHVSNVNVYNLAGSVAACADTKNIVVSKNNDSLTFLIPLTSAAGGGYFQYTGRFAIEFTINVDYETQISYSQSDKVILSFVNGSAEFDINSFFGFFEASLTNANDSNKPIIRAGSSFDVNGKRWTIKSDYQVNAFSPNSSCLLYLYAYNTDDEVIFEFSPTAPSYKPNRKSWYNGNKRALWKMVYINPSQFLFKTYIENDFPQLGITTLAYSDYSQIISAKPVHKSINGAVNPAPETITLSPGVYAIELVGAGGGAGRNYDGTANTGGSGGVVRELISLNSNTSFTAFTGSAGGPAPGLPSSSGTLAIVTTKNYYTYTTVDVGYGGYLEFKPSAFVSTNTVLNTVTVSGTDYSKAGGMSGGGGGGGGSGTFLYSPSGYFLVAGGGSGGSGGSYLTPGGGGGSGGTIGPGAGGGGSGTLSQSNDVGTGNYYTAGGSGGTGGGIGGGSGGWPSSNGENGVSILFSNTSLSGGSNAASYSSSDFSVSSGIPFLYTSTGNTSGGSGVTRTVTTNPIVYVRTSFYFSNSGIGGATDMVSSPNYWLDTTNAGAHGASAPSLNSTSVYGSITPNGDGDSLGDPYSSYTGPGTYASNWNRTSGNNLNKFTSTLTLTIGSLNPGNPGSDGGNNRNSSKGGGSQGSGSITIYKIY